MNDTAGREEREAVEVSRVMDRMVSKVEGVGQGAAKHEVGRCRLSLSNPR